MNLRISGLIAAFALAGLLGSAQSLAQNAYIPNFGFNSVSVINTATNKVTATITDASLIEPFGVAVSPDGRRLYVAKEERNFSIPGAVVVIDTATNAITATIPVQLGPEGIAVTPDGGKVYVANTSSDTVSVISTATNTVIATIPVGRVPFSVAVTPDGRKVFVTNDVSNNVSVISTATNRVIATIGNFHGPDGVAVTPDGRKVYVTNDNSNNVSVISTANGKVTATIRAVQNPTAFGIFIGPAPKFAGTPGKGNCYGQSVSALVRQDHGLRAAAAALGFSTLRELQNAILEFCEGDLPAEREPSY